MMIFDRIVERNRKLFFTKDVGTLAHQAIVKIPVIILAGKEDGPVLWINGTVHGDELNGSFAAWELIRELDQEKIKGTIVITPVCNPIALEHRDKVSAIDFMDMDTVFPGDPEGMFTQRVAYAIYGEIQKSATALINFHTLATPYRALPYTVSKIVPGAEESIIKQSREMAEAFGTEVNCIVDIKNASGELPGVTSGALDITCIRAGIPAFMAEVGHGGVIERTYVDIAKKGILNVLAHLGMIHLDIVKPARQIFITKRKFLRIPCGGLIEMKSEPGNIVKKDELLLVSHYYGETVTPFPAAEDSFVLCTRSNPVVNTGDRIAFVGTEWTEKIF